MGEAKRRGTFEERKAAAQEILQKEWNESVDRNFDQQYAEHLAANPDMSEEDKAKLKEGMDSLCSAFKNVKAPFMK